MIETERHGDVRVLHWRDGENRVNLRSLECWHSALDELAAVEGPLALVVTGEGRFFSNGLDLDRFGEHPDEVGPVVDGLHRLIGRLLVFPAYTVAALNGHTFAAGAMISATFDRRLMRSERGYWCLPEVDIGLALSPGMTAAVRARLPATAAAEAMLTGRRYGADDALAAGIVDEVVAPDELLDRAVEIAGATAGKDRKVLAIHKRQLFADAARACGWTV
ncbi:MAG TPA: enoyl-CoA hydratase/isomerase family protein [Acidimicrobiales bacterium]|nr:enoyl-CoA hydratase/isomerase family protein [Acidimicrobiales bacterium]